LILFVSVSGSEKSGANNQDVCDATYRLSTDAVHSVSFGDRMSTNTEHKILEALGDAMRHRRVMLGFSQETFAETVGLHRTYVGSVERGERNVSLLNLTRIAGALGLRTSALLMLAEEEMDNDERRMESECT
jgi:DNA-binding XRE family transcriptional regulator